MKRWLIALVLLVGFSGAAAAEEKHAGKAFQVHGRMSLYNGNPGFRIWIVGTKRILGVAESPPESPLMPAKLFELARQEHLVFGDFTVVPLTKDEPGVMRMVRVIRAERIVITDGSLKILQRIDTPIAQRANKAPEPTPMLVTPRALISGEFEPVTGARGAPSIGVAHL
jgi:hypothetical protein